MSKILMKRKIPKKNYPNQMSLYEIFVEDVGSFINYKNDIENIDKKYISVFEDLTTVSRTFIDTIVKNIKDWKVYYPNRFTEFLSDDNLNKIKEEEIKNSLNIWTDKTRKEIENVINPFFEPYLNEANIDKRINILLNDINKIDNTDWEGINNIENVFDDIQDIDTNTIKNNSIKKIILKLKDFSDGKIDGNISEKIAKDEDTAKEIEEKGDTVKLFQVYKYLEKNKLFDDLFRILKKVQPFLDQWIDEEIKTNAGKNTDQDRKEQEINARKAIISYIVEIAIFEFIGKLKVQDDDLNKKQLDNKRNLKQREANKNADEDFDLKASSNFNQVEESSLLDIYMKDIYTEEEYLEFFKPIKFTKNLFRSKFTTTTFKDLTKDVSVLTKFIKFISTVAQSKTNKIIAEVNSLTGEDLNVNDIIDVMKEGITDNRLLYATTETLTLLKNKNRMNLIIKRIIPQYLKKLKSIKVGEALGNVANFLDNGKESIKSEGETK